LRKLWVESRLAAGEIDARDLGGCASFIDYSAKQFDAEKLRVMAVEIVFRTKAVATVKIADVGQFHTETMWAIVVAEVAIGFHWLRVADGTDNS
jgi:hypothetical protein